MTTNRTQIPKMVNTVAILLALIALLSTTTTNAFRIPPPSVLSRPSSSSSRGVNLILSSSSSSSTQEEEGALSSSQQQQNSNNNKKKFDLNTALFCGGLAFDAYVEPPQNSSRWEKGSKGMNVAFVSSSFTKQLYAGMVEVTPIQVTGLPEEDDTAESLLTGGGVDACLLVAAVEGQWKEDLELLKEEYHEGILDLTGAAHVGRSRTAWSNVNENQSKAHVRKNPSVNKALPYHIPKTWTKDASAIWPEGEEPFYLYVQDPSKVQLLFTLFDDDVIGDGSALGSTYTALSKVLPQSSQSQQVLVDQLKQDILDKVQRGEIKIDPSTNSAQQLDDEIQKAIAARVPVWEGDLKLSSKPRIKNKNNQITMGAAAGAMVAGPMGAAAGALIANFYEGQIKGRITLRLRYLPIPDEQKKEKDIYQAKGGMPGIDWGDLYGKYLKSSTTTTTNDVASPEGEATEEQQEQKDSSSIITNHHIGKNLEFCFVITHDVTGGCCAVYRELEQKLIVVSFRGTCEAVDLLTDASIVQEPWVEGTEEKKDNSNSIPKVHVGFRKSMNSISRRLKELVLATVAPGDDFSDYELLVTGHSLGGALATLFLADVGEYGMDAGRALPQTNQSDDWWKALANTFTGQNKNDNKKTSIAPPRPKSLRLYNFGSPRVGNAAFSQNFDILLKEGKIDEAYRLVNDQDVVARAPRTMITLSVDYDHCGQTVLVGEETNTNNGDSATSKSSSLWIEGESDDSACPVRDYENRIASPTSEGSLLGDLLSIATTTNDKESSSFDSSDEQKSKTAASNNANNNNPFAGGANAVFQKVSERLSKVTASDVASVIGIDKNFSEREIKMIQSFVKGDALAHHLEDSYYSAMGRASGFHANVGDDIVRINGSE